MDLQEFSWPEGHAVAVSLTFDLDAEAGWLGEGEQYARRLTTLSEGRYGAVRATPRILAMLARHNIRATFFVPGTTAHRHPGAIESILAAGHEIAHHGHLHLRSDKVTAEEQRAEIELGLEALAKAGAPVPTGYRSSSWELTPETFRLLVEYGFDYDSSCMGDDRPYFETFEGQQLLELPVHWSLDDWPRFGWNIDTGGNVGAPAELFSSWSDEYSLARRERGHVTYTMHPEVIGRGQRFIHLERLVEHLMEQPGTWFAPLADVARHARPILDAGR
ncbi:polysaccharide deacetylase [Acrocarpospora pleiomorpha]|uniref:Polysaccharide deacetylase n=1 Tax=Acrocarpospora pleiomorpha TaxID=90975 RepID=A0A5M3Y296_9ACTN|nr:polysaccharide deacetylase [Acrocarpospora pleiomorpha]GES27437.1 polysaccharide deacetylase [Acrocarpospora pleiomorpha]